MTQITRKLEFDAGHRIPDHNSKCRNAHGHRYVLEATVGGPVKPAQGQSDDGMIQDFGDLKAIMNKAVVDQWDHAFLVYYNDLPMKAALACLGYAHRTVELQMVPTVENLVMIAAELIDHDLPPSIKLVRVRLYETPNCWADWFQPPDFL